MKTPAIARIGAPVVANPSTVPIRHAQIEDLAADRCNLQRRDSGADGHGGHRAGDGRLAPSVVRRVRPGAPSAVGRTRPGGTSTAWLSLRSFYGRPAYAATVETGVYVGTRRRSAAASAARCSTMRSRPRRRSACARCWRSCSRHNDASIALFARHGFAPWGRLPARGGARRHRARPRDPRAARRRAEPRRHERSFDRDPAGDARRPPRHPGADPRRSPSTSGCRTCASPRADAARRRAVRAAARGRGANCARSTAIPVRRGFRAVFPHFLDVPRPAAALWLEDLFVRPEHARPRRRPRAAAAAGARSPASAAAAASSGRCSTGTRRRSASTKASARA